MRRRTNACLPGARQYDQYFRQQGQGQQAQSIVSLRKKARRSKLSRSVERHVKYVGLSVVFTEGRTMCNTVARRKNRVNKANCLERREKDGGKHRRPKAARMQQTLRARNTCRVVNAVVDAESLELPTYAL